MTESVQWKLIQGDSAEMLRGLESDSVDSMVTDPPAGIGLLGLEWDSDKGGRAEWIQWLSGILREGLRVLKPGAHAFVWAIPRTSHWTATALEDAGFEVRDVVTHVFGSGFPKSLAIEKAIDRTRVRDTSEIYRVTAWIRNRCRELGIASARLDEAAGVRGGASHWTAVPPSKQATIPTRERWARLQPLLGPAPDWMENLIRPAYQPGESWEERKTVGEYNSGGGGLAGKRFSGSGKITAAASEEAKKWQGWGTALKPASEHWILVRKPLKEHNTAANVLRYGVGALNIDATRISAPDKIPSSRNLDFKNGMYGATVSERSATSVYEPHAQGRFPANFLMSKSGNSNGTVDAMNAMTTVENPSRYFKVFESESPFLYCAKPSRSEKGQTNRHPTVKPIGLMRYLCRMITPPGGTVIDPFTGSGTTGVAALLEGFRFIGIERETEHIETARQRLSDTASVKNQAEQAA